MISITHLGNDGILIESGDHKIIVDGVFRNDLKRWSYLPEAEQTQMEAGSAPFDNADAVLVTHNHRDHFHPQAMGNFLKNSPGTTLIAPQQAIDELRNPKNSGDYAGIMGQVSTLVPAFGATETYTVGTITIEVLGMYHFNMFEYHFEKVQNNSYLITVEGKTLLHMGDIKMTEENFSPFAFHKRNIDMVFLPLFADNLSEERRDFIMQHVNPKQVVSLHAQIGHEEVIRERVTTLYPGAIIWTDVLEKVEL